MTTPPESRNYITVVSGLPRSGTSMMMRMLEAGGLPVIADHQRQSDEDNPRGYYEFEPVKKTRDDPSWTEDAPGQVVKMVYLLLYDLPTHHNYRIVFMRRRLEEVVASQNIMLKRRNQAAGPDDEAMMNLFRKDLAKLEQWLDRQDHIRVYNADYARVIQDPIGEASRISEFLGGLAEEAMAAVVEPSLYRNRK